MSTLPLYLGANLRDPRILVSPVFCHPVLHELAKRRVVFVITLPQRWVEFAGLDSHYDLVCPAADQVPEAEEWGFRHVDELWSGIPSQVF